jgi:RHS repeat-associated protein
VGVDGNVVSHYEYDPYGNTIAQSDTQEDFNPVRFSSKYCDGETGFYYYGFRFYSPQLGRWLSRDPIEEEGGVNILSFLMNSPLGMHDYIGMAISRADCEKGKNAFLKANPKWGKMISDAASGAGGKGKCLLHWNFSCSCSPGALGTHVFAGDSGENKIGEITLCCNLAADTQRLHTTIAHELTHFFDFCDVAVGFGCDSLPLFSKERYVCLCAEEICKEMRAFRHSKECDSPKSCLTLVRAKGYLKGFPCEDAYKKGGRAKDLLEELKKCPTDPGYPNVTYPPLP